MTAVAVPNAPLLGRAAERLRVLMVAPYTPSPIRVRPYQLLRQLVARGHEVTLVCPDDRPPPAVREELQRACARVVTAPLRRIDSLRAYLQALPGSLPLQAAHCLAPAMVEAVRSELYRGIYDVVHIEHLRAAEVTLRAAVGIPDGPPLVLDAVDSISLLFERTLRRSPTVGSRAMALLDLGRTRRYEAAYGQRFAQITITSPEDRWALKTLRTQFGNPAGAPISVVPNGVDLDYFAPLPIAREPETLVFTGKMSYHANEAAARFLLDAIMPHIWSERPTVRVIIAGANPSAHLLAYSRDSRVAVTGSVPDLRPYLARATVAVAPIRYGVGVQNKVLEAMAMGTPVVAARQATVALGARPGAELLVADDAAGFAAAVLALLHNPDRREALGDAGRAYVERHHSWAGSAMRLEGCYKAALQACTR